MKMRLLLICSAALFLCVVAVSAQTAKLLKADPVAILKAEDERRYDAVLKNYLSGKYDEASTVRALLAAGRIGDEAAVEAVAKWLEVPCGKVAEMAAFALGEIESIEGDNAVLRSLADTKTCSAVRARAVEAAGKIAAANAKDEKAKELGAAIVRELQNATNRDVVLLALTAALRARPEGTDAAAAKFLTHADARVRADAGNTLARIRAKNANETLRKMLAADPDPIARANAARALGAAEDKDSFDILLKAAAGDKDSRMRVSAVRSLANLKDARAADRLLARGETLLAGYKRSRFRVPAEKNELLEIAAALGRILPNAGNERAANLLRNYGTLDRGQSPEIYIARLRIAPGRGDDGNSKMTNWRQYSTLAQLIGEFASIEPMTDEGKKMKSEAPDILRPLVAAYAGELSAEDQKTVMAAPDVLRAYAQFKTDDLTEVLLDHLKAKDVFIRATAAELLGEQPASRTAFTALESAFAKSLQTDKHDNDAQLAILSAMAKIDKAGSVDTFYIALDAPDYLVRKRAFEILDDAELLKKEPGAASVVLNARAQDKHRVHRYDPKTGTKLGQVLNRDADYRRALARKNGKVSAVLTTEKGTFTIDLLPEDAPLTVDNFIKLARANYFNGLEVHRVVPNFVMQDGDPRGDGNGGPGWSIRCEVNMVPYERGAVGMALSGKDTGGSQWFATHSPQPHLDGGYTVFGRVSEAGMKVVDNIVRGDKILRVRIVERR